ncbi:MAG TPA: hypothetical protein VFQ51_03755 [Vicinamibacteria bacterium]|nr:hypothetical protein [Vicinamibacteria bacterium]
MGFDVVEMLGVSRQTLLVGALAGLGLAVLVALVRSREGRGGNDGGLGLDRERFGRR